MLNSSTKKTFPNKDSHFLFASAWRGIWRSIREGKKLHWSWNAHTVQLTLHNTWRPYSFKRFGSWPSAKGRSKEERSEKTKAKLSSHVFFFRKAKFNFLLILKVVTHLFFAPNRIRFLKTFNEEFFVLLFLRPSLRNAMFLRPQACAMPCFMFVLEMLSSTGFQGCFFS